MTRFSTSLPTAGREVDALLATTADQKHEAIVLLVDLLDLAARHNEHQP